MKIYDDYIALLLASLSHTHSNWLIHTLSVLLCLL